MKRKKLLLFTLGLFVCVVGYLAAWFVVERGYVKLPQLNQPQNSGAQVARWVVLPTGIISRLVFLEPSEGSLYSIDNDQVGSFEITTGQRTTLFTLPEQSTEAAGLAVHKDTVVVLYSQQFVIFSKQGQQKVRYEVQGNIRSVRVVNEYWAVTVQTTQKTHVYFYSLESHTYSHTITIPGVVEISQLFTMNNTLYIAAQSFYPETQNQSIALELKWSVQNQEVRKSQMKTSIGIFAWHNAVLHEIVPTATGSEILVEKNAPIATEFSIAIFGTNSFYAYAPAQQTISNIVDGTLEGVGQFEPDTQYCGPAEQIESFRKTALPCWQSSGEVYVYLW